MFPKGTLAAAYTLWYIGDKVKRIVPMKTLTFEDVNFVTRGRKNLYDFRLIMTIIDDGANKYGMLLGNEITGEDVLNAYTAGRKVLKVPMVTTKGRVRSTAKMSWYSVLRLIPDGILRGGRDSLKQRKKRGQIQSGVIPLDS